MKKHISIILLVCMAFSLSQASAETEKRNAIEFIQLFQYRVDVLKYEYDFDCHLRYLPFGTIEHGSTRQIHCAAGDIFVQQDSEVIDGFITTLFDYNVTEEKKIQKIMSAIMALSALEYSQSDEDITIAEEYKLGICPQKNAVERALNIWSDIIAVRLNDDSAWESIFQGEKFLVYEGNYNYYVSYFVDEYDGKDLEYVHLTAESK